MRLLLAAALLVPLAVHAEPATERYADVQLQVAQEYLQRARDAAQAGEHSLAGALAWQAVLDARLAAGMTETAEIRVGASAVANDAQRLVHGIASSR